MEENWLRVNKQAKIAIIDTETFNLGLNFQTNRPWQIGALKIIGDSIQQEVNCFVKWDDYKFKIGDGAAMVTHFNQHEFDKKAISPDDAFPQFWPLLKWADRIIMHNGLRFDMYMLKGYAEFMGEDWSFILDKIIDTKSVAQGIKLNRPYQPSQDNWLEYQYRMAADRTKGIKTRLEILGKEYGIPFDYLTLHDGLNDVKLNQLVWNKLKYQLEL